MLEKAGKEKEKIEQQKEKAENVRKRALERLGETEEREGRQKGQKTRRGDMADMMMSYLKEKNEQMVKLRRDELEVKKAKLEINFLCNRKNNWLTCNSKCSNSSLSFRRV